MSWDTKVYNIHWKVPSAATGLEFEWFSLSLVMKMSSNLVLTLMPLPNKSRGNWVMSYPTFLTRHYTTAFQALANMRKMMNMTPCQLFVLLNCYISQHTLRVMFCLSLTLHFELIKASISMTWCHLFSRSYFITAGFQGAGLLSLMPNAHCETEDRHSAHIQRLGFLYLVTHFSQRITG